MIIQPLQKCVLESLKELEISTGQCKNKGTVAKQHKYFVMNFHKHIQRSPKEAYVLYKMKKMQIQYDSFSLSSYHQ